MATHRAASSIGGGLWRVLPALFCLALGLALGWVVLALPTPPSPGLVQADLEHAGVTNPVTAVLLNFRSYDTLLEVGVLLLAVFGIWSLPRWRAPISSSHEVSAGPVLLTLVRLIIPFMVVVAAYLLWLGADAPGGAFQGGAVLGAAWVLLLLSGILPGFRPRGWPLRTVVVLGFGVFLTVAGGVMAVSGHFLEYPPPWAKALILLIEAALTLSIGVILAVLFAGSLPEGSSAVQPISTPKEER